MKILTHLFHLIQKTIALPILSVTTLLTLPNVSHALLVEQLQNHANLDKDLQKRDNLQLINQQNIAFQYQSILTNGKTYRLAQFSKPNKTAIDWHYLVLHDSEDAGFDSGLQMVADTGGKLLVLENQENRNLYDFGTQSLTQSDPNRMFWRLTEEDFPKNPPNTRTDTTSESAKEIKINNNAEFANYVLEQLDVKTLKPTAKKKPSFLLALHNNRPKGSFGLDYIDEFGNTQVACSHDSESKNLFWIATSRQQEPDSHQTVFRDRSQQLVDKLCHTATVNVVTESVPTVADGDGSLSIYMANRFPAWQYVNIEIKAGKKDDSVDETRAKNEQLRYIHTLENTLAK